jgi:nucleoside-diphosphate-sugar epimerase
MGVLDTSNSFRRTQLIEKYLDKDSRILVLGASGWFGRTILDLASNAGIPTLGLASYPRTIDVGNQKFDLQDWNLDLIKSFKPTIVIDCAFLTPDRLDTLNIEEYVSTNMTLITNFITACEVETVCSAISISSGASIIDSDQSSQINPKAIYGELKKISEDKLVELSLQKTIKTVIARVWSVSGVFVIDPEKYAFSNLISQARNGRATLKTGHSVWRRYCSAADFLTIALILSAQKGHHVLESGGELIELHELADRIQNQINPELASNKSIPSAELEEFYCSDGKSWRDACQRFDFKALNISEQISEVSNSFEVQTQ